MNATHPLIRSLVIVSLGGFACSKPPASTQQPANSSTIPHHSDAMVSSEVESAANVETEKEPEKAPEKVAQTDLFTADQQLDLVIAVDEAVGDGRGIDLLAAELNTLSKVISAGMDTRIHFMVGGPLVLPDVDAKKVGFVDQAVGPTDIIGLLGTLFANGFAEQYVDAAGDALAAPLEFRKTAKLEILVFSTGNGEDDGNLAVDFDPNNTLKANVSAVVALPDSVESDECAIEAIGQEYIDLSKKLSGSLLDVCSADFAKIFSGLTADLAKRNLNFKLTQKPADPRTIAVTVNGKQPPREGWFYDAKNNAVSFLSTNIVVSGAKIEVKYDPARAP